MIQKKFNEIINKYSKIIRLDLNYFIKNGFWLSLGQIFIILKSFILSILFANLLTKEVYGQYSFIIAALGIAAAFALPGMTNAVIKSISNKNEGIYNKSLIEIFKYSILGSIFLIIISIYGYYNGREYGTLIFLLLAIIFPFYTISTHFVTMLNGKKKFELYTKINIVYNIIYLIIMSLLIYFKFDLIWLILGSVLPAIFIFLPITIKYSKKYLKNKKYDEKALIFGKKISITSAILILSNRIDIIIVGYFLGFEKLAIYTFITLIPNQLKNLANTYTPLILPKLVEKNINKDDIFKNLKKIFLLSSIIIVFYSIIAPILFKIFYPTYLDYVIYSIIFNISFITFPQIILNLYLVKKNQNKSINIINIIIGFYMIIGTTILTYFFGLIGAIISRMIYRSISLILNIYFVKKID